MKLMIVDDSPIMRTMIKRTLRQAGFANLDIVEAGDGREALEMYDDTRPDLVLADWNMPEMTGIELLEALVELNGSVRLGFITSERGDDTRTRAMDAGARFILPKPFNAEMFERTLTPWMRRQRF